MTTYENVYIAGCGRIGRLVASRWLDLLKDSSKIGAVVCSDASQRSLQGKFTVTQANLDDPRPRLPEIQRNTLLYYFVPPPPTGITDTRCKHFLAVLDDLDTKPRRIIAISTTGVYGDCGGDLINEEQIAEPMVDRAKRRYDMEQQLKAWAEQNHITLIILRVGGIYGPNRLPLARIKEGVPMLKEELAPKTNRIHEKDLVTICLTAANVDHEFRIYNVSDGTNSNMAEYFNTIADHFGLTRPPAIDWQEAEEQISQGMLSYLKESRRIDNRRMLKELDITLRYPTLEDGLAEIMPR